MLDVLCRRWFVAPFALAAIGTVGSFGCNWDTPPDHPTPYRPTGKLHRVKIVGSPKSPRISTDRRDALGRSVTIKCSSCHTLKKPNPAMHDGADLTKFHQGLTTRHGKLTCLSCHGGQGYDSLRLADGLPVPFEEVMTLCRQCHGPQSRDFEHGSHGGMTGYWDRSKGGRTRNNCVVCHDPHAPAYQTVQPARGPVDRFLDPPGSGGTTHD